ncbi:hypothetical protein J437_LFUL006300 [Ladona fulva]|uniref:Helitron helicase-like domain-containing protein n=1 Tax=Ladona fulva TaxID=123851 RepID=A0A8K0NYJ0_LADFU|nr:hypothetical protein J437_LFUL006300 [Ladona fulva]
MKEMLIKGQPTSERQDLIARVFKQKQLKRFDVITKGHVFGAPKFWMYTIESQKQGLPHSHNFIWLTNKIKPSEIDEIISAEFPDPIEDSELFTIVKKHDPGTIRRAPEDGVLIVKLKANCNTKIEIEIDRLSLFRRCFQKCFKRIST